jgi:hypothetical protein
MPMLCQIQYIWTQHCMIYIDIAYTCMHICVDVDIYDICNEIVLHIYMYIYNLYVSICPIIIYANNQDF